jgi:AcrR family transcriptional regulator
MKTAGRKAADPPVAPVPPLLKEGCPESGPLRKKCRADTTRNLLEAGLEVFSQHGYDAATTKLVAKRAGINESLINRYFDGKKGLLLAIVREFVEHHKAAGPISTYPEGETIEQDILVFCETFIQHHLKIQRILKVMLSRAIVDPEVRDILAQIAQREGNPLLLAHLKSFHARGMIRAGVDIEKTCFSITQTCVSMSLLGHLVMGIDLSYIRSALAEFARNTSVGIGASPSAPALARKKR